MGRRRVKGKEPGDMKAAHINGAICVLCTYDGLSSFWYDVGTCTSAISMA